ncbi:MAG: hypothetical protein OHK0052_15240 [Anaerolineales bacterium]
MNTDVKHPIKSVWWLGLAAALMVIGYLAASKLTFTVGFPLDDAWIHQTYARNLGVYGEWSFRLGQVSAGSTSPLWSLLLAFGYMLRVPPLVWAFIWGWLLLWALGVIGWRWATLVDARYPLGVGLLLVGSWQMVWAAVSGMETLLAAVLATLVLGMLATRWNRWGALGALVALGAWIRPDLLTLLGPVLVSIGLARAERGQKIHNLLGFLGGFLPLFLLYLGFNRWLGGTWLPNTFYAKQAEYAILYEVPLWKRFLEQFALLLVGGGVLLLPGVAIWGWVLGRRRDWAGLTGLAWVLGYLGVFALRLPVTYQHGRYAMPAMAVFWVFGALGWLFGWAWLRGKRWGRVIGAVWGISTVLVMLLFLGLGAQAYGQDVAVIETEMVAVAQFLGREVPPDALLAVHDIGAVGYFAPQPMLDLAGLVSPEVVPFLRDEAALARFLDARGAAYLVAFPGWYPLLVQCGEPVFVSGGKFAPELGGENLTVYRWRSGCVLQER